MTVLGLGGTFHDIVQGRMVGPVLYLGMAIVGIVLLALMLTSRYGSILSKIQSVRNNKKARWWVKDLKKWGWWLGESDECLIFSTSTSLGDLSSDYRIRDSGYVLLSFLGNIKDCAKKTNEGSILLFSNIILAVNREQERNWVLRRSIDYLLLQDTFLPVLLDQLEKIFWNWTVSERFRPILGPRPKVFINQVNIGSLRIFFQHSSRRTRLHSHYI